MERRASFALRTVDGLPRVSCFYWDDEACQECAQHARDILANLNRGALVGMTSAVRPIPRCGPRAPTWVDQRSSTINAPQRCVSSVRSQADADPFRLAALRCNHTVAACSRPERESTSTRRSRRT